MSDEDQPAQPPQPTEPQMVAALEGWQALTGHPLQLPPQDVWRLATWFRTFREHVEQQNLDDQIQPAVAFMPAGAGALPVGPRGNFRLGTNFAVQVRPEASDDLAFLPVSRLARLIESREVSPVELTRLYLERCTHYRPRLECIVTLIEGEAMAQAKIAEAEIIAGTYRGALHGIPWGIKDIFSTRGVPTTEGRAEFKSRIIDHDAAVVERLRDAGAILVAKLAPNQGGTWFGGTPRNPWSTAQTAGASSGGPASATAAALVGFSIGQENTGSLIWPSLKCGVAGLRPTFGRVSRDGSPQGDTTMGKVGPICRGVEDCATVFHAIHGSDGRDWAGVDAPFTWEPANDLANVRVGYVSAEFEAVQNPEEMKLYETALEVLRSLGATLIPVALPFTGLYPEAAWLTNWSENIDPDGVGRLITAIDYLQIQRVRTLACRDMARVFTECSMFLYPGEAESCMWATNWTGNPALQVPCGFVEGTPRGITFIGKAYDEAGLLAAGLAYERATNWHNQHPVLD